MAGSLGGLIADGLSEIVSPVVNNNERRARSTTQIQMRLGYPQSEYTTNTWGGDSAVKSLAGWCG